MTTKEKRRAELYRLVDEPPNSELLSAQRYIQYLKRSVDALLRKVVGPPEDDKPETKEERASAEAKAERGQGEERTWNRVRKELVSE